MVRRLRFTPIPKRGRRNQVPLLSAVAALVVGAALVASDLELWQGEAAVTIHHGPSQRDLTEVTVFRGAGTRPAGETAAEAPPDSDGGAFVLCGRAPHRDCVVDGDTFYAGDAAIRIADIDAPETSEPACAREADLGAQATRRLLALLNAGPFVLQGGTELDRYGRSLHTVLRNGRSIGAMLVAEGLAEPWQGDGAGWCI